MIARRRFISGLAAAGTAALVLRRRVFAAESTLETTSVRLPKVFGVCISPQDVAEELLHAEGFTDVHYIETEAARVAGAIGHGELDFGLNYAPLAIPAIDAGESLTMLAASMSAASNCLRRRTSETSQTSKAGASVCKIGGRPRMSSWL